jgi:hypothetical protein
MKEAARTAIKVKNLSHKGYTEFLVLVSISNATIRPLGC